MSLNKVELIQKIVDATGITKKDAQQAIDTIVEVIGDELSTGGEVSIAGFGKFSASHRAARTARSPATGESVDVPAKTVPKFTAAKALKETVNS